MWNIIAIAPTVEMLLKVSMTPRSRIQDKNVGTHWWKVLFIGILMWNIKALKLFQKSRQICHMLKNVGTHKSSCNQKYSCDIQSSSTHCSKVISKVQISDRMTDRTNTRTNTIYTPPQSSIGRGTYKLKSIEVYTWTFTIEYIDSVLTPPKWSHLYQQ